MRSKEATKTMERLTEEIDQYMKRQGYRLKKIEGDDEQTLIRYSNSSTGASVTIDIGAENPSGDEDKEDGGIRFSFGG